MYLRTTQRKNKDGSVTQYYQLAHSERHRETGKSSATIIHSFGRADQLDRDALVRLCRSIARVCNVVVVDPEENNNLGGLPEDISILRTVEYGTVRVVAELWERYGLGRVFREVNTKRISYDQALLALVANRLCHPESKLGVWDRWFERVYLPECADLKLRQMYEAMDMLHESVEQVEQQVFFQVVNLFNLSVDLIFYDTTTASFAVDYEDEEADGLRRYGHAKEGMWAPQVVVALAVTREGIPVRSWVFPGNTADVSAVEKIKGDLRGWNLGRALFVADSGMNPEDNRKELAKACGTYLLATRMASVVEVKEIVLSQPGQYRKLSDNLHAKEVKLENGKRYIVCFNPAEAERQSRHREEIVGMLEEELKKHKDKSATQKWAIALLASKRYKRYLSIDDGNIGINRTAIKGAARYDGKWVLETNDETISLEDAAYGYRGLMVIERCFRSLKRTQIKMMPMYHWLPRRIETHVKICVLALSIERLAEIRCGLSWSRIRAVLSKIQATEFSTSEHFFYQLNELPKGAKEILKSLAIDSPRKVFGIRQVKSRTAIT